MMNVLDFQTLLLSHTSIVILTLLLVKIAKLPLLKFSALYFVMSAINVVIHELLYPGEFLIATIVTAVVGFLITVILVGLAGDRINASNYSSIMAFAGLTPWYLGVTESIIFLAVSILILAGYSFFVQSRAFKSVGHSRYVSLSVARQKMTDDEYSIFMRKGNVIFALPLICGLLLSVFLIAV